MGSLFHCRHSVRSRHAISRDGSKPPRGVRIEKSGTTDTQAARSAGKVQLSDGLAPTHEYRCRPSMAASRYTRDSEVSLPASGRRRGSPLYLHKNAINASMVSSGRSSMSQCPVSFKSTAVTVAATSFIWGPRIAALAFSPAMDRMGMVNFVLAI